MRAEIPFSPPDIREEDIIAVDAVLRSGWITTGPVTQEFENALSDYLQVSSLLCLNSATAALELALRLFGVSQGDEVIVPAYTFAATANVVLHLGATPVFADCAPGSFHIGRKEIAEKLSSRTKAVIPVDFGGLPVNYDEIIELMDTLKLDTAANDLQSSLGRPLLLADSAHALGAEYRGCKVGSQADMTAFSFHAVKNLTTAEGGALCFSDKLDGESLLHRARLLSLHGQSKDAHAKTMAGNWRYEILEAGYKYNMTDIAAALGLSQLRRYPETLLSRKKIEQKYRFLLEGSMFDFPLKESEDKKSSYHLCPVSVHNAGEENRDRLIHLCSERGIALNVHYIPLPLHPLYQRLGFHMRDFPNAYAMYENEISLPIYPGLSEEETVYISRTLRELTRF